MPVAQLSSTTFSEIERVLTSKSVAIHYRKIEIRNISLVAGKEEYNSENLFSSDCPCRIVICFIESKNKTGSPILNPFDFKRSWKVTVSSNEEVQLTQREQYLEQKLLDFEKQLAFFKSCVTLVSVNETPTAPQPTNKGKGRGKRSVPEQPPVESQPSTSFFDRFRPSFSGPSARTTESVHSDQQSTSHHSQQSAGPPSYNEATATATEKIVYIKQVDLLLNGAPLDQIDTRETGNF